MNVEVAPAPADEQAHGERHDHRADGELGHAPDDRRKVPFEQDEWQPDRQQRRSVAEPPAEPQSARQPRLVRLVGEHEAGDGGQVVGVGRMAEAEQQRGQQREHDAALAEVGDRVVESVHAAEPSRRFRLGRDNQGSPFGLRQPRAVIRLVRDGDG
jgi:hypothetical protein